MLPASLIEPLRPDQLAEYAVAALHAEAVLTPKPGLVDQAGTGGHTDMGLAMLLRSADALRPTFTALAAAGRELVDLRALRDRIGVLGRAGERAMLQATGGVNTHRGALWTLGLLVTAAATTTDERQILHRAAALAATPDSAGRPDTTSHGQTARSVYGATGAVGEAVAGFPHLARVALPRLRTAAPDGIEEAQHRALLALIATVDDTCILHRGGNTGLRWMQHAARQVLAADDFPTALHRFAAEADRRQLSPGGSADLLAGAILLQALTRPARATAPLSARPLELAHADT